MEEIVSLKVLIINRHVEEILGGSEIQCDLIAKNLAKLGHQVLYLALESENEISNKYYDIYPLKKLTMIKFINIINYFKPDIIYWRYNKRRLLKSALISKLMKVKFIYSLSHVNDVTKWVGITKGKTQNIPTNLKLLTIDIKSRVLSRINYFAFYIVDGVISLKQDLLNELPSKFNQKNSMHIYNSMEHHQSEAFNWHKPYIVWVANIKKPKNPEIFIQLADDFKNYNIDFLMIGKIQDNTYNYLLKENNLPENFHYLGKKEIREVDSILSESLFMIHTCNPEGFGNNFIQAWNASKPTLTVYFDPDNLIEKNKVGSFSGNYENLKKDVQFLLDNPDKIKKMGIRASGMALELFNPAVNARKLEKFLLSII